MVGPVLTKCFCHCKLTVKIPSDTYSLASWPIVNAEAEDARQEMLRAKTHEVVPLRHQGELDQARETQSCTCRCTCSGHFHDGTLVYCVSQRSDQLFRG